jgi:hypothetical protein
MDKKFEQATRTSFRMKSSWIVVWWWYAWSAMDVSSAGRSRRHHLAGSKKK